MLPPQPVNVKGYLEFKRNTCYTGHMQDIMGQEVEIGDIVLYNTRSSASSMHLARVKRFYERQPDSACYVYSLGYTTNHEDIALVGMIYVLSKQHRDVPDSLVVNLFDHRK
jgi:hypothetical protein